MASRTTSAVTFGLPSRSPPIHDPGRRIGCSSSVGVGPTGLQRRPNLGVDLRDDLEERGRVVTQPGLDLVLNLQPGQPDQRGLPQHQDLAAQFEFDVAAVVGMGVAVQAQPHQLGDAVLGVEHGAAPGLGRVRGDHRRHQCALSASATVAESRSAASSLQVRRGQAAVLRRLPGGDVDRAAALTVDVLGDVGEQCEVGERADDRDGLVTSMPSNSPASSARSISERRTRNDSTRARSTRSNTSSPFCSRTVSPRIAPSSRMSSRIGSVASRPTWVRRTDRSAPARVGSVSHLPLSATEEAGRLVRSRPKTKGTGPVTGIAACEVMPTPCTCGRHQGPG